MDRPVYKCECGFCTHFQKALEAHCRFKKHKPAVETIHVVSGILPEAENAPLPEPEKAVVKKTRKPRTKKTVATKE